MSQRGRDACAGPVGLVFEVPSVAGCSDGELLGRFAGSRGAAAELAFEALLERHGPMVLRVCRRVLGNEQDALDAFQATFLVLVRRAGSVRRVDSAASWLHGVAFRVASAARGASARRRRHERHAAEGANLCVEVAPPDDRAPLVHAAIARLPERYRAPLVLCHLEGLTHEQAAEQLGWPVGTVKSRLARGRDRLRDDLARRGLDPAGSLAPLAPPIPPVGVVAATARAALRLGAGRSIAGEVPAAVIALMKGFETMMMLKRMVIGSTAALVVGIAGAAVGIAQDPPPTPLTPPAVPAPARGVEPEITYETRFIELTGLAWRGELWQHLVPIAHKGASTVWLVDDATLAELTRRGQVIQAPKVSAFVDSKATIINQAKKQAITGVRERGVLDVLRQQAAPPADPAPAPPSRPDLPPLTKEAVTEGIKLQVSGRVVEGSILARFEVDGDHVVIYEQAVAGRGVERNLIVHAPEIIHGHCDGESLIPPDATLLVGLGVHNLPRRDGAGAELREQLVAIRARPIAAGINPPPAR